jgi:hypothetical protein
MATIGRHKAVADSKIFPSQRASRVADMVIRAHHLPCRFRNRLLVLASMGVGVFDLR